MAKRVVHKADGSKETIDIQRFKQAKNKGGKVPFEFKEVVPLTDQEYKITKEGICLYDEEPAVESGLDDDGLLFARFSRFMQVGIEHVFRYIHLYQLIKANSVVLDAACGYGELGKLLYTERKACTYVGMDIAGKKLKAAINLRWGRSPTLFIQRDLSRPLPFEDDTFDFAVSTEFIEHVPKKNAMDFLREVVRVTKKGGKVIITTPNNEWGEVDPVHPNEYSYDETLDMVSEVGLKTVDTYGLKLRGNVREWDKKFGKNAIWKSLRAAYPSIWAKCMLAAVLPEESIFWSLVAIKP